MSETLTRKITTLPSANDGLQPIENLVTNVNIARSAEGNIQIILEDCEAPSEEISLRRASLQSGVEFRTSSGTIMPNCLVLEFDLEVDSSGVAKVAEHLSSGDSSTNRTGEDLSRTLQVFRTLVESQSSEWNFKRMLGLWGELSILERALSLCEIQQEELACLRAWQSNGIHCQDYCFRNASAAFDVKTTAKNQRIHEISSIDQVAEREQESSYLLSVVVRPVGPGEGWTVLDLVNRIEDSLSGASKEAFIKIIESINPDQVLCGAHYLRERHNRPPMLFVPNQIPGVSQFTPLPEGVPSLSWAMTLSEGGMSGQDIDNLLRCWLLIEAEAIENE
ncbi:MAG: hypothetical protein CMA11_01060 [Euryarchaeota archaeon]|nr:hypothetical protein [Euryarchaeota archaeon]